VRRAGDLHRVECIEDALNTGVYILFISCFYAPLRIAGFIFWRITFTQALHRVVLVRLWRCFVSYHQRLYARVVIGTILFSLLTSALNDAALLRRPAIEDSDLDRRITRRAC
jgi:hypothetical protein